MSDQTCPSCGGHLWIRRTDEIAANLYHGMIRCPDCTGRVPATEDDEALREFDEVMERVRKRVARQYPTDAQAEIVRLREALDAKHEREESEISAIVEERDRLRGELAEAREDRDFATGREHSALDSLRRACDERNALTAELAEAQSKCERLLLEAQIHHGEDAGHKASLIECYKAVGSNAADWNGSRPVREYVERMEKELAEARDHAECWRLYINNLHFSLHHVGDEWSFGTNEWYPTPEAAVRAAAKALGIET